MTIKHIAVVGLLFAGSINLAHADKMDDKMMMMDTSGDGMVSRAEHDAFASKSFGMMDANGDGMMSKDEMKMGKEKMEKEMKEMKKTKREMKKDMKK